MSLVVCSNQDSNATTTTTQQSIYKPYAFRNALSSTYTIPANGQVALQSCKYNLDGTVAISGGNQVLYQYYGQDLGAGDDINTRSTAYPIRTQLYEGRRDGVQEVNAEELGQILMTALNNNIYHPNLRNLVEVNVVRDGTTNEFQGYEITYGQYDGSDDLIPTDDQVIDQLSEFLSDDGVYQGFEYVEGTFASKISTRPEPAVGLLAGFPLSAQTGILTVDFTDANENGVDWGVGLSRYCEAIPVGDDDGVSRQPPYFQNFQDYHTEQPSDMFFYDYIVCRQEGKLRVFYTVTDYKTQIGISSTRLTYGEGVVPNEYDLDANSAEYDKVIYAMEGQRISISMISTSRGVTELLYEYEASRDNDENLSCVSQAKWNMYPVLYLAEPEVGLVVDEYTGCLTEDKTLKDRLDTGDDRISWYNSVEDFGGAGVSGAAESLENRPWNIRADKSGTLTPKWADTYFEWADILTGPNKVINLENYLIMRPDTTFRPSRGANTEKLLGFDTPTGAYDYDGLNRIFTSSSVPQLLASRSMFVRLENMTQHSVNARQGNRSSIIAHLPRFDGSVETGRIFHEPKNLIFLDLNNPQPMNVSSFDISFVYSNETYVQSLTGQSVVCLYFREKPSEKIQQV